MVYCKHCNTEYGGIRGIVADKCPRCVARESEPNTRQRSIFASGALPSSWRPTQLATAGLSSHSLQASR